MLKSVMFEEEMEQYLIDNNYDIWDSDQCIDSVKVSDIAIDELGYIAEMNEDGVNVFTKY